MTWRSAPRLDHLAEETGNLSRAVVQSPAAGPQAGVGIGSDEKAAEDAAPGRRRNVAAVQRGGQRELIYDVEGTAAQIEATLASLAAQPDVFLSFSVNPPQGELPPTHLEFEQRTQVSGPQGGPERWASLTWSYDNGPNSSRWINRRRGSGSCLSCTWPAAIIRPRRRRLGAAAAPPSRPSRPLGPPHRRRTNETARRLL